MSQTENTVKPDAPIEAPTPRDAESIVDTLFDLVEEWAVYGLTFGKRALESAAKALGRTAQTLDKLALRLEKKSV